MCSTIKLQRLIRTLDERTATIKLRSRTPSGKKYAP